MIGHAVNELRRIVGAVSRGPAAFRAWVRVDYPQPLPRPGHLALVALCGQEPHTDEQSPKSSAS
jgi:hypothetical protein